MSQKNRLLFSTYPSRTYVFVVISLATFLCLFAFGRRSQIRYQVAVSLAAEELPGEALTVSLHQDLMTRAGDQCRDEEFVYAALESAGLGDQLPPHTVMATVQDISRRLSVRACELNAHDRGIEITLDTAQPATGIGFLDRVASQVGDRSIHPLRPAPAKIVNRRGGSVSAWQLVLITLASGTTGLAAAWLSRRLQPTAVLYSEDDIKGFVEFPVLDLAGQAVVPTTKQSVKGRRWIKACITAAEFGIAAVFLLMLYNVVATELFSARFLADPLAAYSEALAQLVS